MGTAVIRKRQQAKFQESQRNKYEYIMRVPPLELCVSYGVTSNTLDEIQHSGVRRTGKLFFMARAFADVIGIRLITVAREGNWLFLDRWRI